MSTEEIDEVWVASMDLETGGETWTEARILERGDKECLVQLWTEDGHRQIACVDWLDVYLLNDESVSKDVRATRRAWQREQGLKE
mgnify:CR=1 FL=1